MADNELTEILKTLNRGSYSIKDLSEKFGTSKSALQKLISNLFSLNLVRYEDGIEPEKKSQQLEFNLEIQKESHRCYVLVIHTFDNVCMYLFCYGKKQPISIKNLTKTSSMNDLISQIDNGIDHFVNELLESRKDIKSITIVSQGIIEQGESGLMKRNDNLDDVNKPLAEIITEKTSIKCFAYSHIHGLMQSLKADESKDTSNSLLVNCDNVSLDFGIFINNEISLGYKNTYPDFSHLPQIKSLQQSLSNQVLNEKDYEDLFLTIKGITSIFNISNIYLAGSTFEKFENSIDRLNELQKQNCAEDINSLNICFEKFNQEKIFEELNFIAFDNCTDTINPQIQKNSLADFIANNYDPSFVKQLLR